MSVRRVLLFDIDGTLVWGGPAKDAFEYAMMETYGTTGDVEGTSFAGKTDPQIARELLTGVGYEPTRIDEGLERLFHLYTTRLEALLPERPVTVLPGVPELLETLGALDRVGMALLTGNVVRGAQLKLGNAGLFDHFALGSYGSDAEHREELPGIALERAQNTWGDALKADDAIVVGDTPRDIACARAGGMRVVAVATGSYTPDQLAAEGADHVFEDFRDLSEVVSVLAD